MLSNADRNIINSMNNYLKQLLNCSLIRNIKDIKIPSDGFPFASILLVSIYKAFNSVCLLMKNNYIIEANCVNRFIFEQLCYCLAIYNKNFNEIRKIKVTNCVKYLGLINKDYPKIYGFLSDYAHLEIWKLKEICTFNNIDDETVEVYLNKYKRNDDHDILKTYVMLTILYYEVIKKLASSNNSINLVAINKIGLRLARSIKRYNFLKL